MQGLSTTRRLSDRRRGLVRPGGEGDSVGGAATKSDAVSAYRRIGCRGLGVSYKVSKGKTSSFAKAFLQAPSLPCLGSPRDFKTRISNKDRYVASARVA